MEIFVPPKEPSPFQRALRTRGAARIAAEIGVSVSAVRRWANRADPPEGYRGDIRRMFGEVPPPEDRFYTKPEVAAQCLARFREALADMGEEEKKYTFIEPSGGAGAFYDLLPPGRRIGMDLDPKAPGADRLLTGDYLRYVPEEGSYLVVGNPPFGVRGHLALRFINHSAAFARAIGFVCPQMFVSSGKGSPSRRIDERLRLHSHFPLAENSFTLPSGKDANIAAVFAVWRKSAAPREAALRSPELPGIAVYSISMGGTPETTRNAALTERCDVYLPSTCFPSQMRAYEKFGDLPGRRGYGAVAHLERRKALRALRETDWAAAAHRSTNGALNLRRSSILAALRDAGLGGGAAELPFAPNSRNGNG